MEMAMEMEKIEKDVNKFHLNLPDDLRVWLNKRCISNQIIDKHKIGFNGNAITIPIRDNSGAYVFFKYRRNPLKKNQNGPKCWHDKGSSAQIYGWENLSNSKPFVVLCEGEFDRLALESHNIPAVTSTSGASTFHDEWIQYFKDIHVVYICYDTDEAGRINADKISKKINNSRIISLPELGDGKKDVTDFFQSGKTKGDFFALLENSKTDKQLAILNELKLSALQGEPVIFNPSQDIVGNKFYFTVPHYRRNTDGKSSNPFQKVFLVVDSDRNIFGIENEKDFVEQFGFRVKQLPRVADQKCRWPAKYISQFVEEKYVPDFYRVFSQTRDLIKKYCELKEEGFYSLIAIWVIGTYMFQIFESFPYLGFTGMQGSGKSKMLKLLSYICFNGQQTINSSEASLFRDIESLRPTLIMDESEELNNQKNRPVLVALLNGGHSKGPSVTRQEKNAQGQHETREFELYSPKALANISGFYAVLATRMIQVTMLRAKTFRGFTNPTNNSEDWAKYRHEFYSSSLCFFKDVKKAYLDSKDIRLGSNRQNDLWSPLLSIASIVFVDHPEEFEKFKEFASTQLMANARCSLDGKTISFLKGVEALSALKVECTTLEIKTAMEPYLEFDQMQEITSEWIGHKIKNFDFATKIRRGSSNFYLLLKDKIKDVLERFKNELSLEIEHDAPIQKLNN